MDIHPLVGSFEPLGPGEWLFKLPIVFERIATGPTGILQFMARSKDPGVVAGGGERIYKFAPGLDLADAIALPVQFKDEGSGNNTLIFTFKVRSATLPTTLHLSLHMTFSQLGALELPLSLEVVQQAGHLNARIEQRDRPGRRATVASLALVLALIAVVLVWRQHLRANVLDAHRSIPGPAILDLVLGGLVTMVGLSFDRLRSWVALVVDTMALFRWPELHFTPALLRFLRWNGTPVALGTILAAGVALLMQQWAVPLEVPRHVQILDSRSGSFLGSETSRAARAQLCGSDHQNPGPSQSVQRPRLELVCGSREGALKPGFKLGHIARDGTIHDLALTLRYAGRPDETRPALDWLDLSACQVGMSEVCRKVRGLLCDEPFVGPRQLDDQRFEVTSSPGRLRVDVVEMDEYVLGRAELVALIKRFKSSGHGRFRGFKQIPSAVALFRERHLAKDSLVELLDEEFREAEIDGSLLAEITIELLEEMKNPAGELDQKRSIERATVLQALWSFFAGRTRTGVTSAEAEAVVQAIGQGLAARHSWKPFVSLVELSLNLQASLGLDGSVHRLITARVDRLGGDELHASRLYYAALFALSEAAQDSAAAQWVYFRGMGPYFEKRHGRKRDQLTGLVIETWKARDPGADESLLRQRVDCFWRSDGVCA